MKQQIQLIIFDFDGTLGDTRQTIVSTMQMTIAEIGLPYRTDNECASTIGLPLDGCFATLFPTAGKETIKNCTDTYRRIFIENVQSIQPQTFPYVTETLSALKRQGYRLTIASSRWHKSLSELTRDLGIAEYFDYLVGADDVDHAKPHPEPVMKTLTEMGVNASDALVVGDMNVDILMGANAGAKTCGVTYGNGTREELLQAGADYIINRFDELLEILTPHESSL